MYASFEKHLFASLKDFTTPIPGVLETMAMLRKQGIKIGSTTGYTAKMMEIVRPGAEAKGYRVDNLVTPNEVPAGRPAPYMIYKNMIDLAIPSAGRLLYSSSLTPISLLPVTIPTLHTLAFTPSLISAIVSPTFTT